jgi:hypothetical protein
MRLALLTGITWGALCGIANGLPLATTLVQMAVPWVWVALLVAFRTSDSGGQSAVAGGLTLLAANFAYLGVGFFARGIAGLSFIGGIRFFVLWSAIGLVVGPVAGLVGWLLKSRRTALLAATGVATVSIAEPLALWAHIDHLDAHIVFTAVAVAGVAFPLVLFRSSPRAAFQALGLAFVFTYPVAVALEVVLIALGQVSPPMRLI